VVDPVDPVVDPVVGVVDPVVGVVEPVVEPVVDPVDPVVEPVVDPVDPVVDPVGVVVLESSIYISGSRTKELQISVVTSGIGQKKHNLLVVVPSLKSTQDLKQFCKRFLT